MQKELSEPAILRTLAYFELADFPLTEEELRLYLWVQTAGVASPPPLLKTWKDSARIATLSGYYFLPGREELVERRREAMTITELKLRRARRAAKFIRSVPFLRAIFVCNSVGAGRAKPESDIDYFIIAEKKRIWITRFFTNLILRLFGLRTHGEHQRDRICLSFYVDAAHLNLAPWRIADDDIHFAYWLNQMVPVYDPDNYYEKFLTANDWTKKFLPNFGLPARVISKRSGGRSGKIWKKTWEAMWRGGYGDLIENQAKWFQLAKMKLSLKEKAKLADYGVVITDGVIKLHEHDTRRAYRERWRELVKEIER